MSESAAGRPSVGGDLLVREARRWPEGERLDLLVRRGWIEAVASRLEAPGVPILEARGLSLIPGLVDVHVHFRDPGQARKEGWERGAAGALHGGVTSVVEVQNNPPLSTSLAALRSRHEHVLLRHDRPQPAADHPRDPRRGAQVAPQRAQADHGLPPAALSAHAPTARRTKP
jgi:hypothetical protein